MSLPRRTNRSAKFRNAQPLKNVTSIENLSEEMLIEIFSYLSPKELFRNVRPVCRRWRQLAMRSVLWKKLDVDDDVPTEILSEWIKSAHLLKTFSMRNRDDADIIAEELSKNCKNLESVEMENCWGTRRNYFIKSIPLCHLVTRCRKLRNVNFNRCRFLSRKFFRLLSGDNRSSHLLKKYIGPISVKQMKAFFVALCDHEVHESSVIRNMNFSENFKLRDVIQQFREFENPEQFLNIMQESLTYGRNWRDNVAFISWLLN